METIASWRAKYQGDEENPHVVVTLNNVAPSENLELVDTFKKNGIFIGYQIEYDEENRTSVVTLEFSKLLRYAVKSEREPARLIIEATNSSKQLDSGINVRSGTSKNTKKVETKNTGQKKQEKASSAAVKKTVKAKKDDVPTFAAKIADQLGLKVDTIVIDPDTGEKTPERSIILSKRKISILKLLKK